MKRLSILVGLVCLIAMLLPGCAPSPEPEPEAAPEPVFDQAAEESDIRDVVEQLYAAMNKHDAKGYLALCDEDFEIWDGTVKGKVALEEYLSTDVWGRQPDIQWKLVDEIGIVFVTPDVAIYKERDEPTGRLDADGKPLPPAKRLIARVFVKKSGEWFQSMFLGMPIEQ